ncbi:hypothetical protein ACHAXA_007716 [Cyclostephanos tholiformis]|uniref:Kinesin-like protein n=1 Tax=Cyclostephanos tholiformis TaxID=382380 RepID=A0ABD3RY94_9STRA
MPTSAAVPSPPPPPPVRVDQTRMRIEKMESDRIERRQRAREMRDVRAEEEGRKDPSLGDVDFVMLIRRWREEHAGMARSHDCDDVIVDDVAGGGTTSTSKSTITHARSSSGGEGKRICVCVRKRGMDQREVRMHEHDAVTIFHPTATVHSPRLRVDGYTKYCDHNTFVFDHSFDECSSTEELYGHVALPLVRYVLCRGGSDTMACSRRGSFVGGGVVPLGTVFAYGQTGSGKTYTMRGIQKMVAEDVFAMLAAEKDSDDDDDDDDDEIVGQRQRQPLPRSSEDTIVSIAMFEIYGTKIQDLLNNRNRLKVLEDGKGEVVVSGLGEYEVSNPSEFASLIERGHTHRTTHATEMNDASSRSHAVCQILLREKGNGRLMGKLCLVDLAGSERGNDTKCHDRQRRTESSDINTSLLALKECIRAIDTGSGYVPYRQSKLTLILKDCFVSKFARTAMIATLSPGSGSTDHTVNTLRYADRIKEKKVVVGGPSSLAMYNGDGGRLPSRSLTMKMKKESPAAARSPALPNVRDEYEYEYEYDELDEIMNDDDDDDANGHDHAPAKDASDRRLSHVDRTLRRLLEEEENLLNMHMKSIHENAELLTEEGSLLQVVQGEDYDMDAYALRLGEILDRKMTLIRELRERLGLFRNMLMIEEELPVP